MARPAERRSRITVIDDHPEFLEVIQEVLSDRYDVSAFSGHQIYPEDIVESSPDLLLVDLRLDRGDLQGWDIVELVRAHRHLRAIPIVVCSADTHALYGRAAEILGAGNTAMLVKPFDLAHLEQVVQHGLTTGFPGARLVPGALDDYSALFVGSKDAILVADENGRYLDANDVALRLVGLTREQLRQRSVADLVENERTWTDAEWARFQRDGWWHGPVRLTVSGTRTQLMLATAMTVRLRDQAAFVSWLQPVEEDGRAADRAVPAPVRRSRDRATLTTSAAGPHPA